ncbi:C-type lectin BfL-2-like [Dreissena polymorpha]|uniref:C-type lectin domain-containing protein n=1 Tax=Dreissena polymorpha TaxID=45954 RepID=A0A9D3YX18_DREPO|nr:C-type lectin BfL-2-like [Dreissena polymorpha]KAH3708923.1 hypothetical protein DPMN_068381 [Dreissena polymorpha]
MDTAVSGFKCSATEQIGDVILTLAIQMCMSVCASTDGCKSVFYTRSECVRCRSRYRNASDARLLPMVGSVSYTTVVRCNPGWLSFLDSCYLRHSSTKMTYDQTKNYCSSLGVNAHVLYIDSDEEKDVASNVLQAIGPVWIGIHLKDGSWISSIDDTSVAYFNWALGEPNNTGNREHCAYTYYENYLWNDSPCTDPNNAVCEIDM